MKKNEDVRVMNEKADDDMKIKTGETGERFSVAKKGNTE